MTADEFASLAHDEVIESTGAILTNLLEHTKLEDAPDPYWQQLIPFYRGLDQEGRMILLGAMMQSSVDAVSSTLSLLENQLGLAPLDGFQDAFLAEDEARQGAEDF